MDSLRAPIALDRASPFRPRESPGSGDASSPVWRQSWSLPAWGTAGRIPPEGRSSVSIVRAFNQPALSKLPRAALLTIGLATLINLGLFFVFTAAGCSKTTEVDPTQPVAILRVPAPQVINIQPTTPVPQDNSSSASNSSTPAASPSTESAPAAQPPTNTESAPAKTY